VPLVFTVSIFGPEQFKEGGTMEKVEDFVLKHYGIKGMKWGKRKASSEPRSSDAEKVTELKARVKKGGTQVLTNQELQALVTRMNLEQQHSRLNPKTRSTGEAFAVAALKVGAPLAVNAASTALGPYAQVAKILVDTAVKSVK
jgi:nitrogen fixation protein FixH